MRPGRGYNHPPPSTTEIKRRVEHYLYSPSGYSWHVLGRNLPITPAFFFFAVSALWVTCSGVLSKIRIYENSVKLYPYYWSVFFYIAISRLLLHDIKWDLARSLRTGEEQNGVCQLPLKCLHVLNNSVDGLWLGMDGLPSQDSYVAPPEHVEEIRTCRFSVTWRHVDERVVSTFRSIILPSSSGPSSPPNFTTPLSEDSHLCDQLVQVGYNIYNQ